MENEKEFLQDVLEQALIELNLALKTVSELNKKLDTLIADEQQKKNVTT